MDLKTSVLIKGAFAKKAYETLLKSSQKSSSKAKIRENRLKSASKTGK